MKRTICAALMILPLVLTGCGQTAERNAFEAFSRTLREAEAVTFTARICADTDGTETVYDADCCVEQEQTELTLRSPEIIAGVTATLDGKGAALTYGGAVLELGDVTGTPYTPLTVVPHIVDAMRTGHVEQLWRESLQDTELIAVQLLYGESETITVWFGSDMTPVCAELAAGNSMVTKCLFEQWSNSNS